ncbi:RNHCP domain-containing protein [Candidatus Peregrinibacteria bacterium]|nr:RNHCP domain-containing protein [Candidatus Peregrinibacteria bacterium]
MIFLARQEPFTCEHCSFNVPVLDNGSYRNHCPKCLWSKHVDKNGPGDRESECKGMMKPVGMEYRKKKGWMILQTCEICGKENCNLTAPDDDSDIIAELSSKGISKD